MLTFDMNELADFNGSEPRTTGGLTFLQELIEEGLVPSSVLSFYDANAFLPADPFPEETTSSSSPIWSDMGSDDLFDDFAIEVDSKTGYAQISELDLQSFFAENGQVPVKKDNDTSSSVPVPVHFSANNRLVQDEDKATNTQTQSNTAEKDLSITPSFKAAVKRQNEVIKKSLPPRACRDTAKEEIKRIATERPRAIKTRPKRRK